MLERILGSDRAVIIAAMKQNLNQAGSSVNAVNLLQLELGLRKCDQFQSW